MAEAEFGDFDFYFSDDEDFDFIDGLVHDGQQSSSSSSSRYGNNNANQLRPSTIREHSKAQREKRKCMLSNLERQAEVIAKQKEDGEVRCHRAFSAVETTRKLYLRRLNSFLQSWFGNISYQDNDVSKPAIDAAAITIKQETTMMENPLETTTPWSSIVDINKLVVTMPLIMSFWIPPVISSKANANGNKTGTGPKRLRFKTAQQVLGYNQGFNMMCASIARYGTNVVDSLLFGATVQTDTFMVNNDSVASKFVLESKVRVGVLPISYSYPSSLIASHLSLMLLHLYGPCYPLFLIECFVMRWMRGNVFRWIHLREIYHRQSSRNCGHLFQRH